SDTAESASYTTRHAAIERARENRRAMGLLRGADATLARCVGLSRPGTSSRGSAGTVRCVPWALQKKAWKICRVGPTMPARLLDLKAAAPRISTEAAAFKSSRRAGIVGPT